MITDSRYDGLRYGGFWRSSIAYLIDEMIVYFVSLFLFLIGLLALGLKEDLITTVLTAPDDLSQGMSMPGFLYIVASLVAGMTYFTWFHGIAGRTPGKMLLGLRVIQASGEPMTPGVAFLRWVGYLISGLAFCLGFLWVAFDRRKQGWHDKIAATLVIRERGRFDQNTKSSVGESAGSVTIVPSVAADGMPPSAGVKESAGQPPRKPEADNSLHCAG